MEAVEPAEAGAEMREEHAAILDAVLRARRSIRGFRPDPAPRDLLRRVLEMAGQAPSGCNAQPWTMHIASGAAAERIRGRIHERAKNLVDPDPDVPLIGGYPEPYRRRQIDSAKALFAATGVEREDKAARFESFLRNYRFFDAPHAAFLFVPEWGGMREAADCGMFAQSFMLALTANGLASCPQGALSHHAGVVHDEFDVPADQRLLIGIAFGYEDPDHPANTAITDRASVEDFAVFHD